MDLDINKTIWRGRESAAFSVLSFCSAWESMLKGVKAETNVKSHPQGHKAGNLAPGTTLFPVGIAAFPDLARAC